MAFKIAVIESERGWGSKIDDWMVCLTQEDTNTFKTEFNSENDKQTVPDWYMYVDGNPIEIELNDKQYSYLKEVKRAWMSNLKKLNNV